MFHLNDKFKKPISPPKWRNLVSAFLNNLTGDGVIEVHKPEEPNSGNPPRVGIRWTDMVKQLAQRGYAALQNYLYDKTTGTAAQILARAQAVAATAPKPDKYAQEYGDAESGGANPYTDQEAADDMIKLIGTSDVAARADHRHPLELECGASVSFRPSGGPNTSDMPDDSADPDNPMPSGQDYVLKTDKWKPTWRADKHGFSLLAVTRVVYDNVNGVHYLYYREIKCSWNGNPVEISEEKGCFRVDA